MRRYSRLHSITFRLFVAFTFLVFLVVGGFVFNYWYTDQNRDETATIIQVDFANEESVYQLQSNMVSYFGYIQRMPGLLDLREIDRITEAMEVSYQTLQEKVGTFENADTTLYNELVPLLTSIHEDARRLAEATGTFAQMEAASILTNRLTPQMDTASTILERRLNNYAAILDNKLMGLERSAQVTKQVILIQILTFLMVSGLLAFGVWHKTLAPLRRLTGLMTGDHGRLQVDILPYTVRRDEIGQFAKAFHTLFISLNSISVEMRRQGRLLETIFDTMPLGLYLKDVRANYTYIQINKKGMQILGLNEKQDIFGLSDYDLFPDFEADDRRKMDKKIVADKAPVKIDQTTISYGEGQFIADVIHVPITNDGGAVAMILTLVMDVTKRVEAQQETVMAMEAAERAMQEAEEANQAKSQFLANMSHELRTPMNSVIGLSRLLIEGGGLSEDKIDMVTNIRKSGQSLLDIVNDILDISKIESGQMELESIPFCLQDNLDRVMDSLGPLASEKGLLLELDMQTENMPNLLGDPTRVGRILTNLVGNAIKYTLAGKVTIRVDAKHADQGMIDVTCHIIDTGIGIPENRQKAVFEKFTQADSSTTRKFGGTGLGLAITKDLVELMGGTIGLTSEPEKGSDFFFTIPFETTKDEAKYIRQSKRLNEVIDTSGDQVPVADARVLVAEDHPLNRAFIQRQLDVMGFKNVEIVANGLLAFEAMTENAYDLILMDCQMPEMSGYEATEKVRKHEDGTDTHRPIIALTANAMEEDRQKCIDCGMDEFVSKPVDADELKHILSKWVAFG